MEAAGFALVKEVFGEKCNGPHGIMLTGGNTIKGLYELLRASPPRVDEDLHIILSDERYVPADSPESNYGMMRPMLEAVGIEDVRVLHVDTGLPLEEAVEDYDSRLRDYVEGGGTIDLAVLGLGADGHIASLFSAQDIERSSRRFAVGVSRADGPDRVSVTTDILGVAGRIIFFVSGVKKLEVVDRMKTDPRSVIACVATKKVSVRELWYVK